MIVLSNLFLTAGTVPRVPMQSNKYEKSNSESDDFAAMFRKASEGGDIENIQGAKPQNPQQSDKIPETDEMPEEDLQTNHEEDIQLIVLAAAIIPAVIQEQTVNYEPPADDDAIITNATDIPQIISGLESNKDIEVPAVQTIMTGETGIPLENSIEIPTPVDIPEEVITETAAPEQTARMPQASDEIPEEDAPPINNKTEAAAAKADESVPCPLETENNTDTSKISSGNASGKDNSEQEKQQTPKDTRVFGQSQPVDISPERIIASEQLTQAAESAPQTATVDTLYDTLVDSIFTGATSESKFMEIQLKPEFLGKVAIQLTLADSGLEIKIKADDAGVKGLIADQITQLTSSLSDKGVKVTAVEVVFANVTDHSYDGSGSHRQNSHNTENGTVRRGVNTDFGVAHSQDENGVTVVDAGIASVEYSV